MEGIVILASCVYYFIRVHENLVQHPVIIYLFLEHTNVNENICVKTRMTTSIKVSKHEKWNGQTDKSKFRADV